MNIFIEVITKNGFRKTINASKIINVNETRAGSVITVEGMYEPIFVANSYDEIQGKLNGLGHEIILDSDRLPPDYLVHVENPEEMQVDR